MTKKCLRKCSSSSAIREIQNNTTLRFHLIPVRMSKISEQAKTNIGDIAEKAKSKFTFGGNVIWYGHYRNQYREYSNIKINLPYDLTILLPSICSNE